MNEKLIAAFQRSKLTKYQLAQATGISNSSLGRWERGEQDISLEMAEAIAKAIGYKLVLKRR